MVMLTSNFTLEYAAEGDDLVVLSLPRDQFPEQLKKLGIAEAEWQDLWDYVQGVAARAVQREAAKKQLDQLILEQKKVAVGDGIFGFGKKKKKGDQGKPEKSEYELKKEGFDKDTAKGWNNVISRAKKNWGDQGVLAKTMIDSRTGQIFGVEFECDSTKLQPDKVVLRYDFRRNAWSLPRETVPEELVAIGMSLSSWTVIWDMAQTTLERNQSQETEKKKIHNKMKNSNVNLLLRGDQGDEREIKKYTYALVLSLEDVIECDKLSEKAWKIAESNIQDECLPLRVMATLLVHDTAIYGGDDSYKYSGFQLRMMP
uniref:Uncharacterized protein n=1 Tax=Ditylum brightwellii TaxID=49249 RepID=A0A7S2E9V4_9STRA